jgi:hypothetical protein
MGKTFEDVKNYLFELGFVIKHEDPAEELVIIDDENQGIRDLVIDCEDPLVILEQSIFEFKAVPNGEVLLRLLQMNRELVHGAFVLDETGRKVLFRDTLQLENLDLNELKASILSLTLALAEHASELISFARSGKPLTPVR